MKILQKLLLLCTCNLAASQSVNLLSALMLIEESEVSSVSGGQIELFRQASFSDETWKINQCFKLSVFSPYSQEIYSTFTQENPPACEVLDVDDNPVPGTSVECQVLDRQSLKFWFTAFADPDLQSVKIKFTGFHLPFSSQVLDSVTLYYFSDLACIQGQNEVELPDITVLQSKIDEVKLWSSGELVGDDSYSNSLFIEFTPKTTTSPTLSGMFALTIPVWFSLLNTNTLMYNSAGNAKNKCSSEMFNVVRSGLVGNQLEIEYDYMLPEFVKGRAVLIECPYFYNPITPEVWGGFRFAIYDADENTRIIEESDELFFDATTKRPAVIPRSFFTVDPAYPVIAEYSQWTISLKMPVPLNKECWIELAIPNDLNFDRLRKFDASGMFKAPIKLELSDLEVTPSDSTVLGSQSKVFWEGCSLEQALGRQPFGRLDLFEIKTPEQMRNTGYFDLKIYKDKDRKKLIAQLEEGKMLLVEDMEPGRIEGSMKVKDPIVQKQTSFTVTFTAEHALNNLQQGSGLLIELPYRVPALKVGEVLSVSSPDGSSKASKAVVVDTKNVDGSSRTIQVLDLIPAGEPPAPGGTPFTLEIGDIYNPVSALEAGSFTLTTQNILFEEYFTVDKSTFPSSYTPEPGAISGEGQIVIDEPRNNAVGTTYKFSFKLESSVPSQGYLLLQFPEEVKIDASTARSQGDCKVIFCTEVTDHDVRFLIPKHKAGEFSAGQTVTLSVSGVYNMRSFKPSSEFKITTFDVDGRSKIDIGYNLKSELSISGSISLNYQRSNFMNGERSTFTFSAEPSIPVFAGDKFTLTLPKEMEAPESLSDLDCKPLENIIKMDCEIKELTITMTLKEITPLQDAFQAFSWSFSGIRNPRSTKPSLPFTDVAFRDSDGYIVSKLSQQLVVTNSLVNTITDFSLRQGELTTGSPTSYEISFKPKNEMPKTGVVTYVFPQNLLLVDGAQTRHQLFLNPGRREVDARIEVDTEANTITLSQFLTSIPDVQSEEIILVLGNVRNPLINLPGQNCITVKTYWDDSQFYLMDQLGDFQMCPSFACTYPCKQCDPAKPDVCLDCWKTEGNPSHLQRGSDGELMCGFQCPFGQTTDGDPEKVCRNCDQSCETCFDNGVLGDGKRCIDCNLPDYPFRLAMTEVCQTECIDGQYQSGEFTCSECAEPCLTCKGSQSSCTSCPEPLLLWYDQCVPECPRSWLNIDGVCHKCECPCKDCVERVDKCSSCDNECAPQIYIWREQCYYPCPLKTAPNFEESICVDCHEDCNLCNVENIDECLICVPPLLVLDKKCVKECPGPNWTDGMVANDDGTKCRTWELRDWGYILFPVLILFSLGLVVIYLGSRIRRAYLQDGKITYKVSQNTVTCITIWIAPLQVLSVLAQTFFFYMIRTMAYVWIGLGVLALVIILNWAFALWFEIQFNQKKYPSEIERRVRLFKMTRSEAKSKMVWKDEKFIEFKRNNKCCYGLITFLTVFFAFKSNKLLYSFFCNMKPFQAQFTLFKYYRKMTFIYQCIWLVGVDLVLIAANITALVVMDNPLMGGHWDQLWISVAETMVLSVLSVLLGGYELWNLKTYLSYTSQKKTQKKIHNQESLSSSSDLDKKFDTKAMKQRNILMDRIVSEIKKNKQLFLNNRLDDLLKAFGDRRCKSMVEGETGWQLEGDPRFAVSWPVTPGYIEEDELVQFTEEDKYGHQANNVYADVNMRLLKINQGTQDDTATNNLQSALFRKQSILMRQTGDSDGSDPGPTRRKRRGRKSKFLKDLDHEDDFCFNKSETDADISGLLDNSQLTLLQEREAEEENNLKRQIQEDQKNAQIRRQQRREKLKMLEEENRAKQAHELEMHKRRQSAKDEEMQMQEQSIFERAKQMALTSKRLSLEAVQEQHEREQRLRASENEKIRQSAAARQEYERQEAEREARQKADREGQKSRRELEDQDNLHRMQNARMETIEMRQEEQRQRDVEGYLKNQETIHLSECKILVEPPEISDIQGNGSVPEHLLTCFNQHDVLGALDYTADGKLVLPKAGSGGKLVDKNGNLINQQGYRISPDRSIIHAKTGAVVFSKGQLDEFGQLPSPFNFNQHNFNAHEIFGDFEIVDGVLNRDESSRQDKRGNNVNSKGWRCDKEGNIVDSQGHKKLDSKQLTDSHLLPLYNYEAREFDIFEVMGQFEKDEKGKIIIKKSNTGIFEDSIGRRVNSKGYFTDSEGNIISIRSQEVLWRVENLFDGEFPKIFPFTKFDIFRILGSCQTDAEGFPLLLKSDCGTYDVDNKGRRVNKQGYLTDKAGNVIDLWSRVVFNRSAIQPEGQIPFVYFLLSGYQREPALHTDGSASDQLHEGPLSAREELGQHELKALPKKKRKPKGKKNITVGLLQPTGREKQVAGVYGGPAIGSIQRPGVKYQEERLVGSAVFRIQAENMSDVHKKIEQNEIEFRTELTKLASRHGSSAGVRKSSEERDSSYGRTGSPDSRPKQPDGYQIQGVEFGQSGRDSRLSK